MLFKCALTLLAALLAIEQSFAEETQTPWKGSPRIKGGKDADANEYPYQVSLEVNGSHNCGGAILTKNYIVTAAHCLYSYSLSDLSIRAGSIIREAGGQVIRVSHINLHPDYDPITHENDIALFQLTTPLRLDESVKTIPIAASPPPTGAEVTVVGWGITEEGTRADRLKYTKMKITPAMECQYRTEWNMKNILCLLDKGVSTIGSSDSGGAAIYQGTLVGVASYSAYDCSTFKPSAYTLVPNYADWLKENSDL